MLICVYDTANEAEILKAKITQIATATYRRIVYRVCGRYESFVKECKTADLIIVLANGANGMEGVIAVKSVDRNKPVIWLSDDEGSASSRTDWAAIISIRSRYRLRD